MKLMDKLHTMSIFRPSVRESIANGSGTNSRTGILFDKIATPCFIAIGIAGHSPFLTPDNREKLTKDHCMQVINYADIFSALKIPDGNGTFNFRKYLNLMDSKILLTAHDFLLPSNPPIGKKPGFVIATSRGNDILTEDSYINLSKSLKPDLVIPLTDEVDPTRSINRHRAAVRKTLTMLDNMVASNAETDETKTETTKQSDPTPIAGVVVGGNWPDLRKESAKLTCERNIQALAITDLHYCTSHSQRGDILQSVINEIPNNSDNLSKWQLPRILTRIGSPLAILQSVEEGIDVFCTAYLSNSTQRGHAFNFMSTNYEKIQAHPYINLNDAAYQSDFQPLVADCKCHTCTSFTRAYIHHTLSVGEMVGDILLFVHNHHHYELFFSQIREHINQGTFKAWRESLESNFRHWVDSVEQ